MSKFIRIKKKLLDQNIDESGPSQSAIKLYDVLNEFQQTYGCFNTKCPDKRAHGKIINENNNKATLPYSAFHFHHKNPYIIRKNLPDIKNIAKGITIGKYKDTLIATLKRKGATAKLINELEQCILLCSNCHCCVENELDENMHIDTALNLKDEFLKFLGSKLILPDNFNLCDWYNKHIKPKI